LAFSLGDLPPTLRPCHRSITSCDLTTQAILTYGSWALTAVILVLSIWMGTRERTPFYALMVLAALIGAFAEPLYDVGMMLYFYSTQGMWIGVLEAAQVICFAVAASQLRARYTGKWHLLGLFVLFPCTFYMANFGAGWPTIIALHMEHTSTALIAIASVSSICFALVLVRAATSFLPQRSAGDAGNRASSREQKAPLRHGLDV
jgi:hypothetical protein